MTIPGTYTNFPTSFEFILLNARGISFDVNFTCTFARSLLPRLRSSSSAMSAPPASGSSPFVNASFGVKLSTTSATASSMIGKYSFGFSLTSLANSASCAIKSSKHTVNALGVVD